MATKLTNLELNNTYEKIKEDWLNIIHLNSNIKFMLFKMSEKKIELTKIINRMLENQDHFQKDIYDTIVQLKNTIDPSNTIVELYELDFDPDTTFEKKITKIFNQFKSKTNEINQMSFQIDNFNHEMIFKKDILIEIIEDFIKSNQDVELVKSVKKMLKYMNIYIISNNDFDNINEIYPESDDYTQEYVESLLIC